MLSKRKVPDFHEKSSYRLVLFEESMNSDDAKDVTIMFKQEIARQRKKRDRTVNKNKKAKQNKHFNAKPSVTKDELRKENMMLQEQLQRLMEVNEMLQEENTTFEEQKNTFRENKEMPQEDDDTSKKDDEQLPECNDKSREDVRRSTEEDHTLQILSILRTPSPGSTHFDKVVRNELDRESCSEIAHSDEMELDILAMFDMDCV